MDETLHSWVLSSGFVCLPSSVTPWKGEGSATAPVSWKVEVLGAAMWGCTALGRPGFLLKSCLSFSLPAIGMGSSCGHPQTPQLQCLCFTPGGKPTFTRVGEGDTSAEFLPGQSLLFERKEPWPLGPEGSQLVDDLVRELWERSPPFFLGAGPQKRLRCSSAKAGL